MNLKSSLSYDCLQRILFLAKQIAHTAQQLLSLRPHQPSVEDKAFRQFAVQLILLFDQPENWNKFKLFIVTKGL